MILWRTACSFRPFTAPALSCRHAYRFYTTEKPPALRVLFAGSDDFSATSLRALHQEHVTNPSLISSLHVLCRADGRTGRNRDILKEVPVKSLARSLDLPIHIIKDFKDFALPGGINIIIAVSFGLFVPAHIINAATYGGLNVHPSLLPMYRGAAPLHHTIIDKAPLGGVSIQTLDTKHFDRGKILMQTDPPMAIAPRTSFRELRDTLAQSGAEMLVETLRRGLFLSNSPGIQSPYPPSMARKMTGEHSRVDWNTWTAEDLEQRADMFGTVWTMFGNEDQTEGLKRIILGGIRALNFDPGLDIPVGCFRYVKMDEKNGKVVMALRCKGGWVRVGTVKIEGRWEVPGEVWITGLQKRGVGKQFR